MNQKKARMIRAACYVNDQSPKFRSYKIHTKTKQIIADPIRQLYQTMKKKYLSLPSNERNNF